MSPSASGLTCRGMANADTGLPSSAARPSRASPCNFNGPGSSITLLSLPGIGQPTVVGLHDGRVVIFATLTVRGGRITHADAVLDPDKLADLNLVLDTRAELETP